MTVVVVHGGAGGFAEELREREAEYRAALEQALHAAAGAVEAGRASEGGASEGGDRVEAGAVAAVRAAVMALEDCPLFNAGHGSALCEDGSVEMSASVMRGSDRAAGAVAVMRRTRNPVAAATALLDEPEVLLAGEPADAFAAGRGLEQRHPQEFVTDRARRRLAAQRGQTVGAVCLDATGLLAAATSTGGLAGQRRGRVGDSPAIGAGTWADRRVAVSCTGDGEAFVRAGAARLVAALVENRRPLVAAAEAALDEVADCGGSGGLIALDAQGKVWMPFRTAAMPRGVWRLGQPPVVHIP